ncbi:DUF5997 family protein [Streptosporangium saharense]|uniref:Uncharacterized protein n=1 Tax=Streptosporangium saharense TaxID=1706840 RepID=A0A7W7VP21_9ACTN|nr:DUF5997 family protein [Streptosporangium saharense]MBB4917472.1 hypothetical protein [Streptosporangium saharense]
MTSPKPKSVQTMKATTAAKKLGVPFSATPAEFQASVVTRDELNQLQSNPPAWLADLRRNGPHTKQVVAAKLKVSVAGLTRNGITEPLTTAEIDALKAEKPEWLEREQANQVEVRKEALRLKQRDN